MCIANFLNLNSRPSFARPETAGSVAFSGMSFISQNKPEMFRPAAETIGVVAMKDTSVETAGSVASSGNSASAGSSGGFSAIA